VTFLDRLNTLQEPETCPHEGLPVRVTWLEDIPASKTPLKVTDRAPTEAEALLIARALLAEKPVAQDHPEGRVVPGAGKGVIRG